MKTVYQESFEEGHEILSVVDSKDIVISKKSRSHIHQYGLRHRAVHILVFNTQKKIFLQKRCAHKVENPGLWDSSVAGHVDAGETYDECCLRELQEEIGLLLHVTPQRLFKLSASPGNGMEFSWIYRIVTDKTLRLNHHEIERGEWCSIKEVDDWVNQGGDGLANVFVSIWKVYRGMF